MDQELDLVFRVFFRFCSCSTILDFHQVLFVFGFIYLFGFYVTFNTVQVISQWVVGKAEETST